MRMVPLSSAKTGMTRLRDKGGASADSLYDLLNGYVDASRAPTQRPGTSYIAALPEATKGLCSFGGELVTFSHESQSVPDGFSCEVLGHPTDPTVALHWIHFAVPFLGKLYVVAEFANGDVYHYWQRTADSEWEANTAYAPGDTVSPTTPNGYMYRARRLAPAYPAWQAGVNRSVGDIVEPTVSNGYYYEVVDVAADPTPSGSVEPAWPAADGATIIEYAVPGSDTPTTPTDPNTSTTLPGGTTDRYGKCVAWDSILDDGSLAIDAQAGDLHDCWTPEEGFTRQPIRAVGELVQQPCVRLTLADGSILRCSASTPFTDTDATTDTQDWRAPSMLGRKAFNWQRVALPVERVEDIGMQWVVPIDFGGRSFPAGDTGLVYSHNAQKTLEDQLGDSGFIA